MLDDRFWTKVSKKSPDECWEWTASKNNKGYGSFRPGGIAPKRSAHRVAYEDAKGPIPIGAFILHSCDNPSCVNPAHLRIGTPKQNVKDMDIRGRRVLSHMNGETNPFSKLTADQVISMRREYVAGVAHHALCEKYGVTRASLNDFVGGRSWKHILGKDGCPTIEELKTECARRTRNSSKIDKAKAAEIKRRLSAGELGIHLAAEFGIHKATISDIIRGKIWADV